MNILNHVEKFAYTSLFQEIPKDQIPELFRSDMYRIVHYRKNSIICFENEKCETMDVVLEGSLFVQKIDEAGNVLTFVEFRPGNIFGENLLFSHNNIYPMTIAAKTDCLVLKIKKDLILELCRINQGFLLKFLESVSDKTVILTDKINFLSMKTIREKMVDFLNYESHRQGSRSIRLEFSKKELADRFGIQRPSLSRELARMRDEGLIDFDARTITLKKLRF